MYKQRHILIHISVTLGLLLSPHDLWGQKLHNERRDKVMQDVKKQFAELTNPDTDVFEQAIKNTEATNDADLGELRERNRALLDSIATTLPFKNWKAVQQLAFTARQQVFIFDLPDVTGQSGQSIAASNANTVPSSGAAPTQIDKIKSQITNLETEIEALKQVQVPTVTEIEQTLEDVVDSGKITSVSSLLEKAQKLPEKLDDLKKIVQRLKPQGLTRVILETTLLRYRDELARLQLRQEHFETRKGALAKLQTDLEAYAGVAASQPDCSKVSQTDADEKQFGEFFKFLRTVCDSDHPDAETVILHLQKLAANTKHAQLVDELVNLSQLLNLLEAGRNNILQEVSNLSHDELVFQIRIMQLDAREHEILLSGGITGLATFEAGGVKPQDVANIISMAQALATGAIAARVK